MNIAANGLCSLDDPQPLMRAIPQSVPYPVKALGPLAEVVNAVSDITQVPVAIAAQSALAVASLLTQGLRDVQTLGGDAPLSLYFITVGRSGERKSAADRLLMQAVREYEGEMEIERLDGMRLFCSNHRVWTKKRDRLTTEAASGVSDKVTDALAQLRTLGPEPRPPLVANFTTGDPTIEGLARHFKEGRPSVGIFSDEAGSFLGGHAMNADNRLKTMAGLSRLWNGDAIDRTRSGDDLIVLRGRRVAAHLMGQPEVILPLMSDKLAVGQGFLARCLPSYPASAIGYRLRRGQGANSDTALSKFRQHSLALLRLPMMTSNRSEQELAPPRLALSSEATELLWDYYIVTETAQQPGGKFEQATSFASKSAEMACRIAGVLSAWENVGAVEIGATAMANGIALASYYLDEALRILHAGYVSDETRVAEELRMWLQDKFGHSEVLPSDILNSGPNCLRERKKLTPIIALLVQAGCLEKLPEGQLIRGRMRKEVYRIVRPRHAE